MGKSYYRMISGVFLVALVITLAARIILFTQYTDYSTGFYTRDTGIITVYTIVYWAAALFLFLVSRLRRTGGDYPLPQRNVLTAVLALLTGAAIAAFSLAGEEFPFVQQNLSETMTAARDVTTMLLGLIAAVSFLLFGAAALNENRREKLNRLNWVPAILASVWQVFMLVTRFNSYTTLTTINDNMLGVMFMVLATLFLLGHARTVLGFSRKDGRNYVIPAGLTVGMTGLLLVIPNYIVTLIDTQKLNNRLVLPSTTLGLWESVYILFLSLYAIKYTVGVIRSIEVV